MGKGHSRGAHQGPVKLRFCCAESQEDKTQRGFLFRRDSIFRCRLLAPLRHAARSAIAPLLEIKRT